MYILYTSLGDPIRSIYHCRSSYKLGVLLQVMSEIITLSSDEEDSSTSAKRMKLDNSSKKVRIGRPLQKPEEASVVVLSDEEDKPGTLDDCKLVAYDHFKHTLLRKLLVDENKPVLLDDMDKPVILEDEDKPVVLVDEDKPVVLDDEDKPVVLVDEDKPVVLVDEDKPVVLVDEDKPVVLVDEDKPVVLVDEDKPVVLVDEDKPVVLVNKDKSVALNEEVKKDVACNGTEKVEAEKVDLIEIREETELPSIKENDCEIIDLDKEDTKKSDEKENVSENPRTSVVSSSTVIEPTCYSLLHNFLDVCEASLKNSSHADVISRFPNIWKNFKQYESRFTNMKVFRKLLDECTEKARMSSVRAAVCFRDVYVFIKDACGVDEVCVSREDRRKLKKLEKCINLLVKRIKELEESEVDFDADADSTYVQLDRYQSRLNKIYKKYCELLKKDPYNGRLTRSKLIFTNSRYDQINRAISKKYKNNDKFPTYFDIESIVKRIVKEENLKLGESEIKAESSLCFRKLGDLLQMRRKKELFDTHYSYIQDSEDPAIKDCQLNSILKENYVQGQEKIEKIYEEFVIKEQTSKDEVSGSHTSDSEENSEKEPAKTDKTSKTKESIE